MASQLKCNDLQITFRKGLQIVKFNRPNKRNALTMNMYEQITSTLNEAAKNDDVILTVLTGEGDFYSSGNDISTYMSYGSDDLPSAVKRASARLRNFVSAFIDFPKILIAVVNGPAIGIAATTLALCDVVYASDKATFHTPFTSLGLVAEGCSSYTFPKLMGKRAGEMLYFNKRISAHEALEWGLVSQVFPHQRFGTEVWEKIHQYANLPPKSLLHTKTMIRHHDIEALHEANDTECKQLEERWQSEECINAVLQFLQRKSKM